MRAQKKRIARTWFRTIAILCTLRNDVWVLECSKQLRFLTDEVDILWGHTRDIHTLEHVFAFVFRILDEVCRAEVSLAYLLQDVVAGKPQPSDVSAMPRGAPYP